MFCDDVFRQWIFSHIIGDEYYFKEAGFELEFITYDMAENPLPENIVTEHEKMFTEQGIKIKGLIAVNKG